MKRRLALLGCLLAGACASTQPPPGETPATQELAQRYDELRRLDDELTRREAQPSETPPDCARVGQLRDSICGLAARICEIANRDPANSVASQRCADGKARCQSAAERTQARGCSKK
jgi:hypothetical protein